MNRICFKPDILKWYVYKILLIMRLTTVILIATLMQVSAAGFSQKVTYVQKESSIWQLFKAIKAQTGFKILWTEEDLMVSDLINANFKNVPIDEVMEKVLEGRGVTFVIQDKMVLISREEPSFRDKIVKFFAAIDVRGRVLDENDAPLVGAVVKVKGGTASTATNSNGEFLLRNVDENATLVISFIGYEASEVKAAKNIGSVKLMLSSDKLKEVEINAGYYTVTDRARTGNITKITASTIEKQPVLNPLQALQNRVPGMQITQSSGLSGSGFNVQIRGRNSINGNIGNKPLYIIDDVIYPSASIGSNSQNLLFGNQGIDPLSNINPNDIESIEVLKDADATAIYGSRGANGVVLIKTKRGRPGVTKIDAGFSQGFSKVGHYVDYLNTTEYLAMRTEAFKNDGTNPSNTDYDINGIWDKSKYTNWQKELIGGTANTTNAMLNFRGGTEKASYLLGASYYNEGTVFPADFGFSRYGIRASLNLGSLTDRLSVNFTGSYNHSKNKLSNQDITPYIALAPNTPDPYDQFGQINWANNTVNMNPMALLLRTNAISTDNFIGNMVFNFKVLSNLTFKLSTGFNLIKYDDLVKSPRSSFFPASTSNRSINFTNNSINSWSLEPQLNYTAKVGPGKIDALLGLSMQESLNRGRSLTATNFNSDELLDNILAAGTITPSAAIDNQYRYIALFARLNYSLENKVFLNFTARRDGSTRFGKDRQFANFGAIGIGYLFSEEEFIKRNLPFISLGKIRASYGITGNDQIGDYSYLSLWRTSGTYQNISALRPSLGNSNYGWETNKKSEFALQLAFFKNKLNVEVSYYHNRSSNQLIGEPLPLSTGDVSIIANRPATVQNTGLEFQTDFKVIEANKFKWNAGLNFTIPRNKLVSYPGIESSSDALNFAVGQPLSIKWVYNVRGVNSQTGLYNIEDKDGNGIINNNDRYLYRNSAQYFYGGFNNTLSFKNITLDLLISFTKQDGNDYGATTVMPGRFSSNAYPNSNQLTDVLNRWQQSGDESNIQKFTTTTASGTIFSNAMSLGGTALKDASYARLKTISLSYRLPDKWVSKLHLDNLSFSLSGQNVLTITKYKGLDPETLSMRTLPPLRTFSAGLNLTF